MSLQLVNINKKYNKKIILKDISLEFQENVIYGLLGNNGAGKSTLLNIINNRIFSTSGQVKLIDGQEVSEEEKLNQIYLMSEDNLYPTRNKIKTVFRLNEKFYGSFDWELAERMAKAFDLNTKKRMDKLSTGYRSIAKLIMALCVPCNYIFLDEPVLGLDANYRELFYDFLLETYQDRLRTFVISTHLIEEISNLLEKVIIIDGGQINANNSVEQLLKDAYILNGPVHEIEPILSNVKVLDKQLLGGAMTAYVQGTLNKKELGNVASSQMSLQEYFIKVTSRKKDL